jgi:hypothetical protein
MTANGDGRRQTDICLPAGIIPVPGSVGQGTDPAHGRPGHRLIVLRPGADGCEFAESEVIAGVPVISDCDNADMPQMVETSLGQLDRDRQPLGSTRALIGGSRRKPPYKAPPRRGNGRSCEQLQLKRAPRLQSDLLNRGHSDM